MSFKLNLGCGDAPLDDYINIDLYSSSANLLLDLTKTLPFPDNSVDEIYAKHLIEHFTRLEWSRIKKDWYRVLRPGGVLIIECPDICRWMKRFLDNSMGERWSYWIIGIYGAQDLSGEGHLHKNGFDLEKLTSDLNYEGFYVTKHSWLFDDTPDPTGFNLHLEAKK